jgi:hypothetical protein
MGLLENSAIKGSSIPMAFLEKDNGSIFEGNVWYKESLCRVEIRQCIANRTT